MVDAYPGIRKLRFGDSSILRALNYLLGRVRYSFSAIDYEANYGCKHRKRLIAEVFMPIAVVCPIIYR